MIRYKRGDRFSLLSMQWNGILSRNGPWLDTCPLLSLLEEGAHGELSTTSAQLPDTIWASIYTGVNPAKFEKYFYIQYDRETQGLRNVPDDAIRRKPFWDYLTDAGCRLCVVDVPKFPLSFSINGCQVTNWGAHATKTARASNPPELLREIDARFGPHPVGDCDAADTKPEALHRLRHKILNGVARHGELFRWLMKRYEWDVFFAGFSAPHCIGHHFWHWIDSTHPKHGQQIPFASLILFNLSIKLLTERSARCSNRRKALAP